MKKIFKYLMFMLQFVILGFDIYYTLPLIGIGANAGSVLGAAVMIPYTIVSLIIGLITSICFTVIAFKGKSRINKILQTIVLICYIALVVAIVIRMLIPQ